MAFFLLSFIPLLQEGAEIYSMPALGFEVGGLSNSNKIVLEFPKQMIFLKKE